MPATPDPQLAAAKRQARLERIRDLRMHVAALAVALFVAAFAGLYIQLAGGHDPALAGTVAPVSQSADPSADGSSDDDWSDDGSTDAWSDGTSDDESSGDSDQSQSSSEPSSVTSGQS